MYLHGPDDEYWDDGQLGGWWTKLRDKVIKPVGRVVAAYYTGGASEAAFRAYEAKEAQKKQMKAIKAQEAQLAAMGNAYPPAAYPIPGSAVGMTAYQSGQPSGMPTPIPSTPYPQGYGYAQGMPPTYQPQPGQPLPSWVVPAGAVAGVVLLAAALRR